MSSEHVEAYLCFTVTLKTSRLHVVPYSDYQQFLHDTIKKLHDSGMGYRKIAEWLRDRDYKTPRGKRFYNNHVFSILKRMRQRQERISRDYKLEYGELSLRFIDRIIVNSV